MAPVAVPLNVIDLSQNWDTNTPGFARYDGPSIKWVKRVAFEGVGGMEITSTLHVGTHLDAPNHFITNAKGIGELPLDFLVGPACVVDLQKRGLGDYQIYGPQHFEAWEQDTGITIERGDILVIHTGYHRFYPSNWTATCGPVEPDETRYFIKHPGPTRQFADWVKARGIRWLAVDAGSADHPMNTVIRQVRPDLAKKCAAALGHPLEEFWPDDDIQVMHYDLFPHDIIHIENAGGEIDRILDQRVTVGCFPVALHGRRSRLLPLRRLCLARRSATTRPTQRVSRLGHAAAGERQRVGPERRARGGAGHGDRAQSRGAARIWPAGRRGRQRRAKRSGDRDSRRGRRRR